MKLEVALVAVLEQFVVRQVGLHPLHGLASRTPVHLPPHLQRVLLGLGQFGLRLLDCVSMNPARNGPPPASWKLDSLDTAADAERLRLQGAIDPGLRSDFDPVNGGRGVALGPSVSVPAASVTGSRGHLRGPLHQVPICLLREPDLAPLPASDVGDPILRHQLQRDPVLVGEFHLRLDPLVVHRAMLLGPGRTLAGDVGLNSLQRLSGHPDVVLAALQLEAVNRDHEERRGGASLERMVRRLEELYPRGFGPTRIDSEGTL